MCYEILYGESPEEAWRKWQSTMKKVNKDVEKGVQEAEINGFKNSLKKP